VASSKPISARLSLPSLSLSYLGGDQVVIVCVRAGQTLLGMGQLLCGQLAVVVPVEVLEEGVGQHLPQALLRVGLRLQRAEAALAVVGLHLIRADLAVLVGVQLGERDALLVEEGDAPLQEAQEHLGLGQPLCLVRREGFVPVHVGVVEEPGHVVRPGLLEGLAPEAHVEADAQRPLFPQEEQLRRLARRRRG